MTEATSLLQKPGMSSDELFHGLHTLFVARYQQLEQAFADHRRSNAIDKIYYLRVFHVIDDEEFSRFTPDTQEIVQRMIEIFLAGESAT